MKKFILIIFLIFFILKAYNKEIIYINKENKHGTLITLLSQKNDTIIIKFEINSYSLQKIKNKEKPEYFIKIDNGTKKLIEGAPDIQHLTSSIIIPDFSEMQAEVVSSKYIELDNLDIIPSKGNLLRTVNPSDIPYVYGKEYSVNKYYPYKLIELREPYILRDFHGQTIVINPVRYNPVAKKVRIYKEIIVKIFSSNNTSKNINTLKKQTTKYSNEFAQIYSKHFINYKSVKTPYTPLNDEGNLLIISYPDFIQAIQPLVTWKKQKGIFTEIINVNDIGNNPIDIKNYITDYYNENNLTFLLLVGDNWQIPSFQISNDYSTYNSDPAYGYISGDDSYAEVFVGRFSAETVEDVETQVERTINYEKYPQYNENYYNKFTLLSSAEGPGDNNEYDYEHLRNIEEDLLSFTYIEGDELFDGSQGGNDAEGNPTSEMVSAVLNEGRGLLNYIGHGSNSSFMTSGFNIDNINNLINENKLPFIFDIACLNGNFYDRTCIAETFLRATNNNEPTGAIAIIASGINQSWDPPMAAQDEMNDILTESYENNIKRSFGGIVINGCMFMNDKYGYDGYKITDTWTIFGDPSLIVRTATPDSINVSHEKHLPLGITKIDVTCDIEEALVSLTFDNNIIGTGKITNGSVQITFNPVLETGIMKITVTAFNKIPYLNDIEIVPYESAFITITNYSIIDETGNNNEQADYGEEISFNISLKNIGTENANEVYGILKSNSNYININTDSCFFGDIIIDSTFNFSELFNVTISDSIPDKNIVSFDLDFYDNNDSTWTSTFETELYAPVLDVGKVIINDSVFGNNNGRIEPGEIGEIVFEITNTGHSTSPIVSFDLFLSNNKTILLQEDVFFDTIVPSGILNMKYLLIVDADAQSGLPIEFDYNIISTPYEKTGKQIIKSGYLIEDWESGSFSKYNWDILHPDAWIITDATLIAGNDTICPYQGIYSARSAPIADGRNSELNIAINVLSDDEISFYKRVSCEYGGTSYYDYLEFLIDNNSKNRWHGNIDWSKETFPVSKGTHTFTWKYKKDPITSEGADCAWIDYVILPTHECNVQDTNNKIIFTSLPDTIIRVENYYSYNILVTYEDSLKSAIIINCVKKPEWLIFSDNEDGTALLEGTPSVTEIGTYDIVFSASDSIVFSNQYYNLKVLPPVSIKNIINNKYFIDIYPNPVYHKGNILLLLNNKSNVSINIYNILGNFEKNILKNKILNKGEYNFKFNSSDLQESIYIIKITIDEQIITKKVVVLK
ncbi:MAG: T9SS type A sorting domain-containing protein [Bacteroidales bacterium]|nr:T9SS type A sorting domain-containing protein [Bacteroidales bacterium]